MMHLGEVVRTAAKQKRGHLQVVDGGGIALDILVKNRRDAKAAKWRLGKLCKTQRKRHSYPTTRRRMIGERGTKSAPAGQGWKGYLAFGGRELRY